MATPIPANRCAFSADEIAAATRASIPPGLSQRAVTGVSIDSRSLVPGALFVALRAARDGHEFLHAAARAGAAGAIVERGCASGALSCFEVDDTLTALGELARTHLQRIRRAALLPTIAIGGAAGKTTTKELTAAVMRAVCGSVLATPGNLNNRIGVPMTIFTLSENHRAAVLECGTNQRGEIPRLAEIVRPDAALVLNVDLEHTEGLGSLEGVADEEAALFATGCCAVVGTGEPLLLERVPASIRRITFGVDSAAQVRLVERKSADGGRQWIRIALDSALRSADAAATLDVELGLLGANSALNAAAAVAAGAAALARPLDRDELTAIAQSLKGVMAVEGRMRAVERGGLMILDDSYNANPRSIRSALATAREIADGRGSRLIVALGDMLELGSLSALAHDDALLDLIAARPAVAIVTGPEFAAAVGRSRSDAAIQSVPDSAAAGKLLAGLLEPGDVVLVKGSRGIAMEHAIAALAE
jgi:UDP-N-acetylmuramoyl-tripeptide--D-alanyl-D-alanine ligase